MVLNILKYPHSILTKYCDTTILPLSDQQKQFCQDMVETMNFAGGIGLAAPQVGISESIIAIKTKQWGDLILINPNIIQSSRKSFLSKEGCLSIPNKLVQVARSEWVTISAQNMDGHSGTYYFSGIESACVQHEIDHLEGVLILERNNNEIT